LYSGQSNRFLTVILIVFMVGLLTASGCGKVAGTTDDSDTSGPDRTGQNTLPDPETSPPDSLPGASFLMWKALNGAASVLRAQELEIIDVDKVWSATVIAALDSRDWAPLFTVPGGPAPALEKLLAAISQLPAHGLKNDSFPVEDIQKATDEFVNASRAELTALEGLDKAPGWTEIKALVDRSARPAATEIDGLPESVKNLDGKQLGALAGLVDALAEARKAEAAARARVEISATSAYLRYVMSMKYLITAAPFRAQKNPAKAHQGFTTELVESFGLFAADPEANLKALIPAHPYYRKVMDGLTAYRAMAAEGPFPKVKIAAKLSRGMKGSSILAIKERLSREGYFGGNIDNVFDSNLVKAVEDYQANHGYEVTGILETRHAQSLNVTVERRIQQIELSLQRWRESEIRDGGQLYVRVNIPEFMMEVWKGETRAIKNKVVVGNNNWDRDPVNKVEGRINRTKLFSAKIENLVMNPRWNVPMRIRQVEIDYDLLKKPDYLVQNNYVVEMLPDGREIVYQKSGDGNALGRVKFNFPNIYGIFMHDTNLKPYFKREIRAFSHGCVRLDNPLEVAYFIGQEAAGVSKEFIDEKLAGQDPPTMSIKLDNPVPIFIEYNSTGVDDQGRMMFFSDVYNYDEDFFDGKIPYSAAELALLKRKVTRED
jgi:murein L,D-transpeptidase YcbB/YkuD